jgi:hypothetical protein
MVSSDLLACLLRSEWLETAIKEVVTGEADVYADDTGASSHDDNVVSDLKATETVICNLLGPDGVNRDKSRYGKKLPFLGWEIKKGLQNGQIVLKGLWQ